MELLYARCCRVGRPRDQCRRVRADSPRPSCDGIAHGSAASGHVAPREAVQVARGPMQKRISVNIGATATSNHRNLSQAVRLLVDAAIQAPSARSVSSAFTLLKRVDELPPVI